MTVEYSVFSGAGHETTPGLVIFDCSLVAEQSVGWSVEMRVPLHPLNREVAKATISRSEAYGGRAVADVLAEARESKAQAPKTAKRDARRLAEAVELATGNFSDVFAWVTEGANRI